MNEKDFHFTLPTYVDMRIIKLARVSLISCANQLIWKPDPFSSSYSKFVNEDSFVLCLASLYVSLMGSALYSRRALGD
jgi:hypothetical protein